MAVQQNEDRKGPYTRRAGVAHPLRDSSMSASDTKEKGGSLKELVATLHGLGALGGGPQPGYKSRTVHWKGERTMVYVDAEFVITPYP